jgi:D-serine deaminase-like pyridoxal phosphate-dependent protein
MFNHILETTAWWPTSQYVYKERVVLTWKACEIGDTVDQIQTPSLVLDLQAFERNLDRLMQQAKGIRVRPHAKSHKCPEIARRQIEKGAVGICCQKLSEAAVFAAAGIDNILLTNQVVGAGKLQKLAELAQTVELGVLVDDIAQVQALAQAMVEQVKKLSVYIEVDVGGNRCGVAPQQVARLAQAIKAAPSLVFAGLHCYHGPAQHYRQDAERSEAIEGAAQLVKLAVAALQDCGIEVPCVTGAGTGTFWWERDSGIYTEIQPGSYALMDRDYADNAAGLKDVRFDHALLIQTTVMSVSHDDFVVVDAGLKSMSVDSGMPVVYGREDLTYLRASDEHGIVRVDGQERPTLGQTLQLIPGHCDPTMNLYDDLIVIKDGVVVDIWPIAARGASL